MNPISQELLKNYQARRTEEQKTAFINYYLQKMTESGINAQVEKGGFFNHRNIIVGNLEKAQFIFTAHYDTAPIRVLPIPKVLVFPNKELLSLLIDLFSFVIFLSVPTIIAMLLGFEWTGMIKYYPLLILLAVLSGFIGPTNQNTANDNTSGVIGINEMIFALKDELDDVAFVLFDNEEKGLLGSKFFARVHEDSLHDKIIVNLDCLSNGDHLMIMRSKELAKNTELSSFLKSSFADAPLGKQQAIEDLTYFPSDQMNFKNSVAIVACQRIPILGRYLTDIHTKKDQFFDQENIAYITDSLVNLVKETKGIQLITHPQKLNIIERFWVNSKPSKFFGQVLFLGIIGFLIGIFLS